MSQYFITPKGNGLNIGKDQNGRLIFVISCSGENTETCWTKRGKYQSVWVFPENECKPTLDKVK